MKEPTIAGNVISEIITMNIYKRYRWYKTISSEEKAEAMRVVETVRQAKHSVFMTGEHHPLYGKPCSKEHKAKISTSKTGKIHSEEHKAKIRNALIGKTFSEEHKAKLSASKIGDKHPNWKGGISFEPYCPAFNGRKKEHIRNLCNRTCIICDESILQYFKTGNERKMRLHVDHIDENKMQGCGDWKWKLTALCPSCHGKMVNKQSHLLLELLMLNNKKHQINFMFGDIGGI